jgi:TctA family transporter
LLVASLALSLAGRFVGALSWVGWLIGAFVSWSIRRRFRWLIDASALSLVRRLIRRRFR